MANPARPRPGRRPAAGAAGSGRARCRRSRDPARVRLGRAVGHHRVGPADQGARPGPGARRRGWPAGSTASARRAGRRSGPGWPGPSAAARPRSAPRPWARPVEPEVAITTATCPGRPAAVAGPAAAAAPCRRVFPPRRGEGRSSAPAAPAAAADPAAGSPGRLPSSAAASAPAAGRRPGAGSRPRAKDARPPRKVTVAVAVQAAEREAGRTRPPPGPEPRLGRAAGVLPSCGRSRSRCGPGSAASPSARAR